MDERMLQVVVLAILLGIALMSIARERAFVIVEFTASVQELAMKVVSWGMQLAPAAVFGLLANSASMQDSTRFSVCPHTSGPSYSG